MRLVSCYRLVHFVLLLIMLCAISEMEVLWIILWAIYDILYGYIWYTVWLYMIYCMATYDILYQHSMCNVFFLFNHVESSDRIWNPKIIWSTQFMSNDIVKVWVFIWKIANLGKMTCEINGISLFVIINRYMYKYCCRSNYSSEVIKSWDGKRFQLFMTVDGYNSSAAKFDFQVYYQYLTILFLLHLYLRVLC